MPLQIFYAHWVDFATENLITDLEPKIAAYTTKKIRDLIKIDTTDRMRDHPRLRASIV